MLAALAVTAILGAGVISGLDVKMVGQAVERLQSFDLTLPRPPQPNPPPPRPRPRQAKPNRPAPAAPKASPNPMPEVKIPTPQSAPASASPGGGNSSSNGAGGAGIGTGSGGAGNGTGGGGNLPARLVRNLSRSDYRALAAGRMAAGSAGLAIRVNASGRVDSCRVEQSSGDSVIDSGLCPLVSSRLRFDPARNAYGQPIAYYTHYLALWRR